MEQFINEMKAITGRTEATILGEVVKLNGRIDKMGGYMVESHKEVIARIERLEQHIIQPSQKCEAPKHVNTVQYNAAAQNVEPIGTCVYKGQTVSFFGICKHCGDPILSPSVIGYCTVNQLDTICYPCQKGKTRNAKYSDIKFLDGSVQSSPAQSTVDTSVVVNCDICGKPRKYKSAADYLAKKNYAESLGLPGTMCTVCAKDALSKITKADAEPEHYENPVAFEKKVNEDRAQLATPAQSAATEIPTDNKTSVYDFVFRMWKEIENPAEIKNMKMKDVKTFAEAGNMTLTFDGNEWNRTKASVYEEVAAEMNKSVVKAPKTELTVPGASGLVVPAKTNVPTGF